MAELEIEDDLNLSDDLLPNEGGSEVFQPVIAEEQPEVITQMNRERAMIMGAEPLLEEIFKFFDFAIEDCDSIKNVDLESKVPLDAQIVGMKEAKKRLVKARANLQRLKDTYIKIPE